MPGRLLAGKACRPWLNRRSTRCVAGIGSVQPADGPSLPRTTRSAGNQNETRRTLARWGSPGSPIVWRSLKNAPVAPGSACGAASMASPSSCLSRVVWHPFVPQTESAMKPLAPADAGSASASTAARGRRRFMVVLHRAPRRGSVDAEGTVPFASEAQGLAQDLLHDLVGPTADRTEACVARHALDLVLLHVARAAVD